MRDEGWVYTGGLHRRRLVDISENRGERDY